MYFDIAKQIQCSEADIRAALPNTSFGNPFVAPDDWAYVFPSPQPAYNPVTQRVQEAPSTQTSKGHYEQQWIVVEMFKTQSERDQAITDDKETKRLASVPSLVTMRQARLALLSAGKLAAVNSAIANMAGAAGEAARIEWEFSIQVNRGQPLLLSLAKAMGMTERQVDDIFVAALAL